MKALTYLLPMFVAACFLFVAGCESSDAVPKGQTSTGAAAPVPRYTGYVPAKVSIMPLTEFVRPGGDQNGSVVRAYVGLLDAFGSQIKAPVVFRFELYEHLQRSSERKGQRVAIWPDIDLKDAAKNNSHWREFLRAYEFRFDFEPRSNQTYVLEVTATCPDGKRLSAEYTLKHPQ